MFSNFIIVEFIALLYFNNTSKELQKVNTDLGKVVKFYKSLINFITSIRNDKFFNEYVILVKKNKE
jgi:hypothetical protein